MRYFCKRRVKMLRPRTDRECLLAVIDFENLVKVEPFSVTGAMLDKIDGRVPATGPGMNTPAGMPQPNLDNKTITSQSGTEAISQSNGANGTPGPAGNGPQGGSPGNVGNGTGNGTSLPSNPIGKPNF